MNTFGPKNFWFLCTGKKVPFWQFLKILKNCQNGTYPCMKIYNFWDQMYSFVVVNNSPLSNFSGSVHVPFYTDKSGQTGLSQNWLAGFQKLFLFWDHIISYHTWNASEVTTGQKAIQIRTWAVFTPVKYQYTDTYLIHGFPTWRKKYWYWYFSILSTQFSAKQAQREVVQIIKNMDFSYWDKSTPWGHILSLKVFAEILSWAELSGTQFFRMSNLLVDSFKNVCVNLFSFWLFDIEYLLHN